MSKFRKVMAHFTRDTSGATAIEYALIAAILSLSIIVGLIAIRGELGLVFGDVVAGFSS